ncbi:gliding-associated putative ABC transporter substrate-binding component GldG [Saccharicrinis carchari]|uniref:Gliding-associated putative ABC transporter substrate-binding component GldG n=1 Tax=Saccharicrinis carchari TaxID=1168039 RepID=A0A521E809_SACCC|nr:Gldg family protein [Saccharicrinis carchari]SMO80064.1 gliding-associated putative ABC transporter substrate-binding component GldG [Saccharicrinis carchari]
MINKRQFYYYIILASGIIVLINILANRFFFRIDFTEDQRYTLSETTKDILKGINEPITVTAYFSEGLQPQFDQLRKDFKDLLAEYASRTKQQLVYEFINPNEDVQEEQKAVQAGIQTLMIEAREKDQSTTKKAFMGAVIQIGEESETIPFIQPGAQMEYALSTAIKKMTIPDKAAIGFIGGHGEPSLNELLQVVQGLEVLYVPEEVILSDSVNLSKYKTLAWINPQDTIPPAHFSHVEDYLNQGGNLFVSFNKVDAQLNQGMGFAKHTGMADWLKKKGITVNEDFVVDANCGSITVQQRQGMFTVNRPINFPYLPILSNFADHPVTQGLSAMVMQFGSSLTYSNDSLSTFTPLVFTSDKSAKQAAPVYFNIEKQWTESDFTSPKLTVAGLLKKDMQKIIVIADGDLAVNGAGENMRQVQPDNANFVVNAIDYMSDDTGLIQLRSKQVKVRILDQLDDADKNFIKIVNFSLPIIIILAIGIYRYQKRKLIRLKRKGESYV